MAPGDEQPTAGRRDQLEQLLELRAARRLLARRGMIAREVGAGVGRRERVRPLDVGAPIGPARGISGQRLVAHERLAQREVQVHHPRAPLERGPPGAAGERAYPAQALRAGVVRADLEEPLGGIPEELDLVDCLAGSVGLELRGPVGAQDEQRHARFVCLDDSRQQLRDSGPGRAGHDCRAGRRLGKPEGEEARAALVDVRVAAQPALARQRQDERRVARSRRRAGVRAAAPRQLIHEGSQQHVCLGRRAHHWRSQRGGPRGRRGAGPGQIRTRLPHTHIESSRRSARPTPAWFAGGSCERSSQLKMTV